jgi:hypothetical protein
MNATHLAKLHNSPRTPYLASLPPNISFCPASGGADIVYGHSKVCPTPYASGHRRCRARIRALASRFFSSAVYLRSALCLLPFAFSLLPSAAAAQTAVAGGVLDPQSRPVAGATVIAVGTSSAPLSTRSDDEGRFSFEVLADGSYGLTATATGVVGEAHGVTVSGEQPATVDITLCVSAVAETLVVSAAEVDQPLSRVADSVTIILLRRPRHQGSLTATLTTGRVTVFSALEARGETLDAEPSFGPSGGLYVNDGHAVVDRGGAFHVGRGVEVFARILNLFDREYEEVFGDPSPGRTAFVGVRVAAGR